MLPPNSSTYLGQGNYAIAILLHLPSLSFNFSDIKFVSHRGQEIWAPKVPVFVGSL